MRKSDGIRKTKRKNTRKAYLTTHIMPRDPLTALCPV
jgi:hypothetical protein